MIVFFIEPIYRANIEHSADTLMTFESSYDTYMNSYVPNPGWTPSDSRKIWHIVYKVPAANAAQVAALSLERGAGLIHITDDTLDNPYDTLPADGYMQTLMNSLRGGSPLVNDPQPFPGGASAPAPLGGLNVVMADYSSVTLSWKA